MAWARSAPVAPEAVAGSSWRSVRAVAHLVAHEVQRTRLRLVEDASNVLADDSEVDQDRAPDDQQREEDRRPALDRLAADELHDGVDRVDERRARDHEPGIERQSQRTRRE